MIMESKFTIYGTANCQYCVKAKQLLDKKNISYTYKEIGRDISLGEFHHEIGDDDVRTVPQIMVDNHLVGDYNSLVRYLQH